MSVRKLTPEQKAARRKRDFIDALTSFLTSDLVARSAMLDLANRPGSPLSSAGEIKRWAMLWTAAGLDGWMTHKQAKEHLEDLLA